jgi:hypothetical protein
MLIRVISCGNSESPIPVPQAQSVFRRHAQESAFRRRGARCTSPATGRQRGPITVRPLTDINPGVRGERASERRETDAALAERTVPEALAKVSWREIDLTTQPKGEWNGGHS